VNLFVPGPIDIDRRKIEAAIALLAPYREELGLPAQTVPTSFAQDYVEQVAAVLEEHVPVFTTTFGLPDAQLVEALHRRGTAVGATVTTPDEARAGADVGVDFIVAQGSEAGGHRGTFLTASGDDLIGTAALVPQVVDATGLPVVAAGGLVDGRGIRAALALGASAAQLGTAFLLCPEAGTSAPYREAVRTATASDTMITRAFSGRRARGIVNRFALDLREADLPPYPVMNALTTEIRRACAASGDSSCLSLWAGQGVGLVRELRAEQLVAVLATEALQGPALPPAGEPGNVLPEDLT
jgi:nitronate monooxygenase